MLGEKGVGSTVCQCGRLCVVVETVVTREGVMAARIAEDFCAGHMGKRGFYLGLCVFADEFVFLGQVHQERGRYSLRFSEVFFSVTTVICLSSCAHCRHDIADTDIAIVAGIEF